MSRRDGPSSVGRPAHSADVPRGLPVEVRSLLRRGMGVVDVGMAEAAGLHRSRLSRLARAGLLVRVATGCYVAAASLDGADEWQLFALRARALGRAGPPGAYLTGWAATVIWGYPTLGEPPASPTAVRPKAITRGSRTVSLGRILVADLPEEHRGRLGGVRMTSKAWSVVDLARTARLPDSLVVADAALRDGVDLRSVESWMSRWEGAERARWVVRYGVPTAESPLETLGRFTCLAFDLPVPVANAWVGRDGPERRVDGLLPWHWVAMEGDGALKYDDRSDASKIVAAQHDREFHLRRLGLDVVRYGWDEAYRRRRELAGKFTAVLRDNPPRRVPVRWWKDVPGVGPVQPTRADWPSWSPRGTQLPAGCYRDLDRLR